jgi:uncharacterized protein (TIGR00251 family)
MTDWQIVETETAITFKVRVVPRSSRTAIVGIEGPALKIKLTAPPVEGAANAALIEFIADWLGIRKSAVSIVSGDKARSKLVRVSGVSAEQFRQRLKSDR